jgi:hypothetical protein
MSDSSAAQLLPPLPAGPTGATLRAFIEGQIEKNGALMKDCYSQDVVLNGKLYQETGLIYIHVLLTISSFLSAPKL